MRQRLGDNLGARLARMSLSSNPNQPSLWALVASFDDWLRKRPRGCSGCPLRPDGEWADRRETLAGLPAEVRRDLPKRWWCHEDIDRPCAGMVAVCKEKAP